MKNFFGKMEEWLEGYEERARRPAVALSALAVALRLFGFGREPADVSWIAIALCGVPIVAEAVCGLVLRRDIKADMLVAIALAASLWTGEVFAAAEVSFIMQLGEMLEDMTEGRARAGLERLVKMSPQTARVLRPEGPAVVAVSEVAPGDTIRVLAGETVPVDGTVASGSATLDEASLTGEPMPVDKGEGEQVYSGTINMLGAFDMIASRTGEDSTFQKMVRLVRSADAGKSKIVRLADRWATWIVVAALASAVAVWAATGESQRAVTVLVVFCPCALVLATPTAITAAIGNAARNSFLVKEGDAIERMALVDVVAFDKTGTLTRGTPSVKAVGAFRGFGEAEVLEAASALEQYSEHPLGKAVLQYWETSRAGERPPAATGVEVVPGRGVRGRAGGVAAIAGNAAFLADSGIALGPSEMEGPAKCEGEGATVLYIAIGGKAAGFLALADTIRPDAAEAVGGLSGAGIRHVLLTGDGERAAAAAAHAVGIDDFRAGCLPAGKMDAIAAIEDGGARVCMVGDGINDAPALRRAFVGIAMGGGGNDLAADAADIVLLHGRIGGLPHLAGLSRATMRTIRLNMALSLAINFAALGLAAFGKIDPVAGALVHNGGSFAVIANSALLLVWRRRGIRPL